MLKGLLLVGEKSRALDPLEDPSLMQDVAFLAHFTVILGSYKQAGPLGELDHPGGHCKRAVNRRHLSSAYIPVARAREIAKHCLMREGQIFCPQEISVIHGNRVQCYKEDRQMNNNTFYVSVWALKQRH